MRAYEFMNEGLPVDGKHLTADFLHTNFDDINYTQIHHEIMQMEYNLDFKSEDYTIPADQIFSSSEIKIGISMVRKWQHELSENYSWNLVLTAHCRRMLAYLQGQYLDW
jgi:hypothetical protein